MDTIVRPKQVIYWLEDDTSKLSCCNSCPDATNNNILHWF